MSLLIKRRYAQIIWRLSKKIQENQTLVFHWCSQERLRCKILRRVAFDSVESMLDALGPSAVIPGKSYDEALAPWRMICSAGFVLLLSCSHWILLYSQYAISPPLHKQILDLIHISRSPCVQTVYKQLGYDGQKLVALEIVPEEWLTDVQPRTKSRNKATASPKCRQPILSPTFLRLLFFVTLLQLRHVVVLQRVESWFISFHFNSYWNSFKSIHAFQFIHFNPFISCVSFHFNSLLSNSPRIPISKPFPIVTSYVRNFRPGACRALPGIHVDYFIYTYIIYDMIFM